MQGVLIWNGKIWFFFTVLYLSSQPLFSLHEDSNFDRKKHHFTPYMVLKVSNKYLSNIDQMPCKKNVQPFLQKTFKDIELSHRISCDSSKFLAQLLHFTQHPLICLLPNRIYLTRSPRPLSSILSVLLNKKKHRKRSEKVQEK